MDPIALITDPATLKTATVAVSDPVNIALALVAVNIFTAAAFGIDKARAARGEWRISEANLLLLAFFGGTVGAYSGRALFRHKTRKQPFCDQLRAIAVLQIIAVAALIGYLRFGDALGLGALIP